MRKLLIATALFCAGVMLLLVTSYVLSIPRELPWWRTTIGYAILWLYAVVTMKLVDLTGAASVKLYERLRRPAKPVQQAPAGDEKPPRWVTPNGNVCIGTVIIPSYYPSIKFDDPVHPMFGPTPEQKEAQDGERLCTHPPGCEFCNWCGEGSGPSKTEIRDVREFGACDDGSADATAAIQRAIDSFPRLRRFGFYWPGKAVPIWLERFNFKGESDGIPTARHGGFGLIVHANGSHHVYGMSGDFIRINGAGMSVTVSGQRGGVMYHTGLRRFLRAISGQKPAEGEAPK